MKSFSLHYRRRIYWSLMELRWGITGLQLTETTGGGFLSSAPAACWASPELNCNLMRSKPNLCLHCSLSLLSFSNQQHLFYCLNDAADFMNKMLGGETFICSRSMKLWEASFQQELKRASNTQIKSSDGDSWCSLLSGQLLFHRFRCLFFFFFQILKNPRLARSSSYIPTSNGSHKDEDVAAELRPALKQHP